MFPLCVSCDASDCALDGKYNSPTANAEKASQNPNSAAAGVFSHGVGNPKDSIMESPLYSRHPTSAALPDNGQENEFPENSLLQSAPNAYRCECQTQFVATVEGYSPDE